MAHLREGAQPSGCVEMALPGHYVAGGRRPSLLLERINCAAESQTRVGLTEFHRRARALRRKQRATGLAHRRASPFHG